MMNTSDKSESPIRSVVNLIGKLYVKYQKIVNYLITGVLTTLVNYVVFYFLYYGLHLSSTLANSTAVFCAVIFAYITNKIFVFKSVSNSMQHLIKEAFTFVVSRGFTIALEIGGVFLLVEIIKFYPMLSKIMISVFVVVINYVISHFFVFHKKES